MNIVKILVKALFRAFLLVVFLASYFLMLINCMSYKSNIYVRVVMGVAVIIAYILVLLKIQIKSNNELEDAVENGKQNLQDNGVSGAIGLAIISIISTVLSSDDIIENFRLIFENKFAITFIVVETGVLLYVKSRIGKIEVNFKNIKWSDVWIWSKISFWIVLLTLLFALIDDLNIEDSFIKSSIWIGLMISVVIYHRRDLKKYI